MGNNESHQDELPTFLDSVVAFIPIADSVIQNKVKRHVLAYGGAICNGLDDNPPCVTHIVIDKITTTPTNLLKLAAQKPPQATIVDKVWITQCHVKQCMVAECAYTLAGKGSLTQEILKHPSTDTSKSNNNTTNINDTDTINNVSISNAFFKNMYKTSQTKPDFAAELCGSGKETVLSTVRQMFADFQLQQYMDAPVPNGMQNFVYVEDSNSTDMLKIWKEKADLFLDQLCIIYNQCNCVVGTCPSFSVGPGHYYYWTEDATNKKLKLSAPEYFDVLCSWKRQEIASVSQLEHVLLLQLFFRRLFRVFGHIFYSHVPKLPVQTRIEFNALFAKYYLFTQHYFLLSDSDMEPMAAFIKRIKNKQGAAVLQNKSPNKQAAPASDTNTVTDTSDDTIMLSDIVVQGELGGGSFGAVYKGIWQDHTEVALKKLWSDDLPLLKAELTMHMKIQNPFCVRCFGMYECTDGIFMVTELASGSLLEFLHDMRDSINVAAISTLDIIELVKGVLLGLDYLESQGIVHRDLAARNILITKIDGETVTKVADFGLSRKLLGGVYTPKVNFFPAKWTAPEAMDGHYTIKSDVWSFGILLWEIATLGAEPYPNWTNEEVVQNIQNGFKLPMPLTASPEIYNLMTECWNLDPKARPQFKDITQQLKFLEARKKQNI